MQRRRSAVGVVEAPAAANSTIPIARPPRARMQAEEFAEVAARIRRVVALSAAVRHANSDGVLASAAASAFNAGLPEAKRVLLLAQGQLAVFGAVREEVASQLRQLAAQRDAEHATLVTAHYPLLS